MSTSEVLVRSDIESIGYTNSGLRLPLMLNDECKHSRLQSSQYREEATMAVRFDVRCPTDTLQ